ncbi:MAG: nuclear transport factor 2 family protein [Gemmatimonadota bacterium]
MKRPLFALLAAAAWIPAAGSGLAGQTGEEEVLAVVRQLFDGMRAADSAAVRGVFHPAAQLFGTGERDGAPNVNVIPADRFVQAVGGATGGWDERIWDPAVQIDGNLATVWTPYVFYLNGEFSHCGVDAFLLARTPAGWKIVSLADTRRRDGCPDPPPSAR